MTERKSSIGRALAWTAAAAIVIGVGTALPVIGFDAEEALGPQFLDQGLLGMFDLSLPALPLLGQSVRLLLFVQSVLFAFGLEKPLARRVALGCYLLLVAMSALAIAFFIESLEAEMGYAMAFEPGWGFRALVVAPALGIAATLWWISDRITQTRAAHGVLAIALVQCALVAPSEGWSSVSAVLGEAPTYTILASRALSWIAPIALGVLVIVRPPARWPVSLSKTVTLRSWIDVAGLPLAASMAIGMPIATAVSSLWVSPDASTVEALAFLPAVGLSAVTIAIGVLWMKRVEAPGKDRPFGALLAGALVLLLAFAGGSLAFAHHVGSTLPAPLEGEATFEITLRADERFEPGEAGAMVERLESLGASAEIVSQHPERITLHIEDAVNDLDAVLAALRPHTLALQMIVPIDPEDRAPIEESGAVLRYGSADGECAVLEQLSARLTCQSAIERIEGMEGERETCTLHCLAPAEVTGDDVGEASVGFSVEGEPLVTVRLDPDGGERLARVSRENLNERLAIVYDGEVLSAPVIQSEIPNGRVQITLGRYRDYQTILNEATDLALAISSATRITSTWTLENVRRF